MEKNVEVETRVVIVDERTVRKADSAWSCLVCFGATLSYLVVLGSQFSFGVIFDALIDQYGESRAKTAWIGSIAISLSTMMGPFASYLCNRFSCRTVSALGHMILCIAMLASSYAPNLNTLFFTYGFLTGVGVALPLLANFVIVAKYFQRYRSLANAALTVGVSIGILSINPGIQNLLERTSLKRCFQILSALHVIPGLLALTFDPSIDLNCRRPDRENVKRDSDDEDDGYFAVCKNPAVILVLFAWIVFEIGHYIPFIHVVRYCKDLGISEERGAELYIYFGIAGIAGRIFSGILADTFHVSKVTIAQWGALYLMGVSTLFLPLARTYHWIIVYMVVYGLSDGMEISTYSCLMYDLTGPRQHTQALGFLFLAMSLPLAIGPPIGGLLADETGSYDSAFLLAGVVSICGGLILSFIRCAQRRDQEIEALFDPAAREDLFVVAKETVL